MLTQYLERLVEWCCRHARVVAAVALLAALGAGYYGLSHFSLDSNSENLISPDVPWRKLQARYDAAFPQRNNLIAVVIDGVTPERAEEAAAGITEKLSTDKEHFLSVRRPDGGDFFDRNGMLFLSTDEVRSSVKQLIDAQPFLAGPALDPSLRGVMQSLSTALLGVESGDTNLAALQKPVSAFADTLGEVAEGKRAFLSWRSLMGDEKPSLRETRRFIEIQPKLDYNDLSPGMKATRAIRAAASEQGFVPANGVTVRLTGPVPLSDEEFATIADNAWLMTALMIVAVLLVLWFAVGSFRMIAAILISLFVGLALTTAFGVAAVGGFNVISVAFIALFVGLGVDFGIQFAVRYRAERFAESDLDTALIAAGGGVGKALTLAGLAVAAGFLAFLPTSYSGVAELGLISGFGMLVTYALSITLVPALIKLLKPRGEDKEIGYRAFAPLDIYLLDYRKYVVGAGAALGVLGLALMPFLSFDANPLDLRSTKTESVSTLLDLSKNPDTSPNTVEILAPNEAAAKALEAKLSALPEVSQVLTVDSFIPEDQEAKIAIINDAAVLLESTADPFFTKPPPSDAENIAALKSVAADLRKAAGEGADKPAQEARRLAGVLEKLAAGSARLRATAATALIPGFQTMLRQISAALHPEMVTRDTLPEDMKRDWIAPSGEYRIEVYPKGDSNDDEVLNRFTEAVLAVAPNAVGAPISTKASGDTIVNAFLEAGLLSFVAIAILLWFALKSFRDVALTLAPLVLAGILTLATCVVLGLDLNFANIIALPLLFGIGVAYDIYFVVAWRQGARELLQSSLTRAILFSAATTTSAFGTLWLSKHPGTASMGELLTISLFWILASVLFFLPALLDATDSAAPLRAAPEAENP